MSVNHDGGNAIPEITREEHDGALNAKRVNVVAGTITASSQVTVTLNNTPTIYAVVNTSAAGVGNSIVTVANTPLDTQIIGNVTLSGPLPAGVNNIGFATVSVSNPTLYAVVNTSAPGVTDITSDSGVTVYQGGTWTVTQASSARTITGNLTLSDAKTYIGLVTVTQASSARSIVGNLTLSDSKAYVGLVTATVGNTVTVDGSGVTQPVSGTVAVSNTARSITGNVTLSDAKTYIGLTTSTIGNNPVLGTGLNSVGFATVHLGTPTIHAVVNTSAAGTTDITSDSGVTVYQGGTWTVTQASSARTITGNLTLSDSKGYIGLVTVTQASSTRSIVGNLTLSDPKGFIGLVTIVGSLSPAAGNVTLDDGSLTGIVGALPAGENYIGLASVNVANIARTITGNLTLSDPKGFIGLVTIVGSLSQAAGNVTLDDGSLTGLVAGVNSIGFATVHQGGTWTVTQASAARTITGNVTLSDAKTYIGLTTATVGNTVTVDATTSGDVPITLAGETVGLAAGVNSIGFTTVVQASSARSIVGNLTLSDPKGFIGLVTIVGSLSAAAGNVTLDDGSLTGLVAGVNSIGFATVHQGGTWTVTQADSARTITGNVTLSDAKTYIGLVTATSIQGTSPWVSSLVGNVTLSDPKGFIGLVTVVGSLSAAAGNVTLDDGSLVGLVAGVNGNSITIDGNVGVLGNVTLSDSKGYIGLVTVTQASAARTITGNVTLSDSKTFIGLVTAWSRNAGTTKTLIPLPIAFGTTSVATIAVPTNTFKVTSLALFANATTQVRIKSGATYVMGNASIGAALSPTGGWVETGSVDSPVYIGLAGAASFVVEKNDITTLVGGKIIYFDE